MEQVLIDAFVSILALLITTVGGFAIKNYLIPLLNNKNLTFWVQQAVLAAEKYFNDQPGLGAEKKKFVKDFLAENLKVHVSDAQLDLLIDSTVESIINPIKKEPVVFNKQEGVYEELEVPKDIQITEPEAIQVDASGFIKDEELTNPYGVYETEEVTKFDKEVVDETLVSDYLEFAEKEAEKIEKAVETEPKQSVE